MTDIVAKLRAGKSSKPRDLSRGIEVIGCGMGRTGTNAFSAALEKLLISPVYHSGTEAFRGDASIQKWISLFQQNASPEYIQASLRSMLAGYVGVTDSLASFFTSELCEMYPDAKVICTVRDVDSWWKSWEATARRFQSLIGLKVFFWPVPVWRHLWQFAETYKHKMHRTYAVDPVTGDVGKDLYDIHIDFVKRVVPPSRLHFFNVKDGWEPLCKILDKPIPGEPFPFGNDSKAMEKFGEMIFMNLLWRWAIIFDLIGVIGAGVVYAVRP